MQMQVAKSPSSLGVFGLLDRWATRFLAGENPGELPEKRPCETPNLRARSPKNSIADLRRAGLSIREIERQTGINRGIIQRKKP